MDTELLDRPQTEVPAAEVPATEEKRPGPKKRREKPPKPPKKPGRAKKSQDQPPAPEDLPDNVKKIRSAALRKGMLRLVTKNNAVNLTLVVLISIVAVIFLLSMMHEGVGNFTISLSRADMYKYGIELSPVGDFETGSARLDAESIVHATNISVHDLPQNLEAIDGSHNGRSYMAYTFYVRNKGTADLDYQYAIFITEVTRKLDTAVRVAVYLNGGDRQIFAKKGADGQPEPDTIPFASDQVIDSGVISDMKIGTTDKYTVVIWIEGDDPQCTDELLGGAVNIDMQIEVIEPE